jgi:hypothetical protein
MPVQEFTPAVIDTLRTIAPKCVAPGGQSKLPDKPRKRPSAADGQRKLEMLPILSQRLAGGI